MLLVNRLSSLIFKLGEDWTLAGLGAALMGIGSALTGWAALKSAGLKKKEEEQKKEKEEEEHARDNPTG